MAAVEAGVDAEPESSVLLGRKGDLRAEVGAGSFGRGSAECWRLS